MERPQIPTPALVSQYVRKFDANAPFERDLTELFGAFPENVQLNSVLLKVSVLNAIYSTKIRDVFTVSRHILGLSIDPKLARRAPELVNEIANTPNRCANTPNRWEFSFATKYCSWHVPEAYPISDRFVKKLVYVYRQYDEFSEVFGKKDLSRDYVTFKGIIEAFRNYYGLTAFSFKDLDKFLLLYSKEYFGNVT